MGRTGSDRVKQYQNWFNLMHRFIKRKPYWIVSVSNRIKTSFHPETRFQVYTQIDFKTDLLNQNRTSFSLIRFGS
ncbi:hypothetical protein HanPSC8_Chr07g0297011 [Helianthus annuus]|nr:hypothetical protein HanPSC8_Chr07g0297011 [Helianthus annuus]